MLKNIMYNDLAGAVIPTAVRGGLESKKIKIKKYYVY
jgi:hypothetical protein